MRRLALAPAVLLATGYIVACTKDAPATRDAEEPVTAETATGETTTSAGVAEAVDDGDPVPTVAEDEPQAVTADDQSNDRSDVEVTRLIRRSLTQDDALSTYAHNVKIITQNGQVVLKGPVRTSDEKRIVEERARKIAGATAVTSELVVTPR